MSYDFYDLLGIDDDASQEEVKRAFRERVREYHPDHNDDPRAPAQFTALKKGYDVLKDESERQAYDRLGHTTYVGKRMDGLPDPEEWVPADDGDDAERDDGDDTDGDRTASDATSGGTASRSETGRTATGESATNTDDGDRVTSGPKGRTRSTSSDSPGSARRDRRGTGTANDGGTTTGTRTSRRRPDQNSGIRAWLRQVSVGWPLVFLAIGVYLAGAAGYALANRSAVAELVGALRAAGTDPGSLLGAVTGPRYGLADPWTHAGASGLLSLPAGVSDLGALGVAVAVPLVVGGVAHLARGRTGRPSLFQEVLALAAVSVLAGGLVGGPLLAGAVVLPVIYAVIVWITRETNPNWSPTYLYVVSTLAPVVGLALAASGAVSAPGVVLEVVAFGLLPVGAIVALLASAGLRKLTKRVRAWRRQRQYQRG